MRNKFLVILLVFVLVVLGTANVFAVSTADMEQATLMMKNFKLDIQDCPTLEEVAKKQFIDVRWSNPGGGDDFYCYAKLMGVQQNHEVFSVIFRYDIENKSVEPFSLRIGQKLYVKMDVIQKYLVKFYATECEELRRMPQQNN